MHKGIWIFWTFETNIRFEIATFVVVNYNKSLDLLGTNVIKVDSTRLILTLNSDNPKMVG